MTLNAKQARFVAKFVGVDVTVGEGTALSAQATFAALRGPLPDEISTLSDKTVATDLAKALKATDQLAASGAFDEALARLEQLTEVLAVVKGASRAEGAAGEIPKGMVTELARSFEFGIADLQTQRLRSVKGLGTLSSRLRSTNDPELHAIADRIAGLADGLPERLEATLSAIKSALDSGDMTAAAAHRAKAQSLIDDAMNFLSDNQVELALCEQNPFDAPLDLIKPLSGAIKLVRESVARL